MAASTGCSRPAYGSYEEGRATPPLDVLLELSAFYNLNSLDQLLGLTEANLKTKESIMSAYYRADPEMRKIVDFILKIGQ